MADNWDGAPQTWSNETFSDAKLNREIRDRMDALKAGLLDASADADIVQTIKSGTLAARAGVAHLVGRQYFCTDIRAMTMSNGTTWEHVTGPGVFDDFNRANVVPMDAANSVHAWTENEGDINIVSNQAQATTLVGGRAHMTMETGGIIRTAFYRALIFAGGTTASINVGIVLKRSATGILYVQLNGGTGQLRLVQGAAVLKTATYASVGGGTYVMKVQMIGSHVIAEIHQGGTFGAILTHGSKTDIQDYEPAATSCGIMFGTAAHDNIDSFSAKFN